ncbi:MAG: outer membrane lipoprotein carrier protein LolA [Acidobacteriota bacterium]|nr:outer membrane lipoprotein carrier protein LolA [Acidobacteriota bacterium]
MALFALAISVFAADPLDAVLAQMDASAAAFKSMSANIKRISHTAVINEDSVDSGTIKLKRSRKGARSDTRMIVDLTAPDRKTVALEGDTFQIYLPKIKTVQEYDLGKKRDLLDQFLLLGFGTPGRELSRAYDTTFAGAETVEGHKAGHLQLIPKSPEVLKQLKKVDLWISDDTGYPLQQKFTQPSGDYTLVTFSDLKANPNVPDSVLKLQLPKGVKREYPQR